jgi:putative membrane protein
MLTRTHRLPIAVAIVAALALPACVAGPDPVGEAEETASPGENVLSPSEIEGVLILADFVEIHTAAIVLKRSKNQAVLDYAHKMIDRHTDAFRNVARVARSLGEKPEASAVVRQMAQDARDLMRKLSKLEGAELDRAYIDSQIQMHQKLLDLLSGEIQPRKEVPEITTLIDEARQMASDHLKLAQTIREGLE